MIRSLRVAMTLLVPGVVVLAMVALAGQQSAQQSDQQSTQQSTQQSSMLDGAGIYQGHGCSGCHGEAGEGGAGPALAGNPKLWNDEYVVNQVLRGGGGMPPFRHQLSDAQVAAVASYVRTSWGNDLEPVESSQVAQHREELTEEHEQETDRPMKTPASGSQLFAWNCMTCHGVNGGGGVGPPLAGNDILGDANYVVAQILLGGGGMPPFAPILDSEEIAAVATYIRGAWNNDYGEVSPEHVRIQWEGLSRSSDRPSDGGATNRNRTDRAEVRESASSGEELYSALGCGGCHSKAGAGGIGPALDGNPSLADGAFVVATIRDGREGMPAFAEHLGEHDLAVLANYVRNAWSNDFGPVEMVTRLHVPTSLRRSQADPPTADPEAGEALFGAVGCSGCHSSQGAGGIGPALDGNPALEEERYVVDTILTGGKQMPAFGSFLTDAQVATLATYVRTAWSNDFQAVDIERVVDLRQRTERRER